MGVYAIDGGCVGGGELIAQRLDGETAEFIAIQIEEADARWQIH